jgi:exodeoxyribonuclease V alpha subunit
VDPSYIRLAGVVERITYHNAENGWSVLKVAPFDEPHRRVTVVIYQAKVFAGSSMEFWGEWGTHPKHGEQFKAMKAIEKKPASIAALEKYLGSGLIQGVGPKTATRIVKYFKEKTLDVFETRIDDLLGVPGIAEKKLLQIKNSWQEHKAIRDVMLFLQGYGISTLFAVKIYKTYGNESIQTVSKNPYQLAKDIHGIGFFSADKIALSMGFERDGEPRIEAGIKHVLASSREEGHCYLTQEQIIENTTQLLDVQVDFHVESQGSLQAGLQDDGHFTGLQAGEPISEKILKLLSVLLEKNEIKTRHLNLPDESKQIAYYSKSLYFDEKYVSDRVKEWLSLEHRQDTQRIRDWVEKYCQKHTVSLSDQQLSSVVGVTGSFFSILTGGPGCGKTTTTRVLVRLLQAMNKNVILAAPTGRAAQRMSEVIGGDAKTIHRLLEVDPTTVGGFKKNETNPISADFFIVDECSMLDISLAAALLKAIPKAAQVLWIGDPDQLPSVGAGNVLFDLIRCQKVPCFRLTQVFRQAEESLIIRYAHQMNQGEVPRIDSPFHKAHLWKEKAGCVFIDAEEATQEQVSFFQKSKAAIQRVLTSGESQLIQTGEQLTGRMIRESDDLKNELKIEKLLVQEFNNVEDKNEILAPIFSIPEKFKHVNLVQLNKAQGDVEALKTLLRTVHPWSALHYGMTAQDMILRLYTKTIPEYFGANTEIQVLTPQVRGSLGTLNLNKIIQTAVNPERPGAKHLQFGDRVFREGDRVIQTRNNYDLGVFNGDIGKILEVDLENYQCSIQYGKQAPVIYEKEDLTEISLAYGITIHKSQGSEFEAVIIPVTTQHYKMLFRNLVYTGLTRSKKLCVFVGSRKALSMAVRKVDSKQRQTALASLVAGDSKNLTVF